MSAAKIMRRDGWSSPRLGAACAVVRRCNRTVCRRDAEAQRDVAGGRVRSGRYGHVNGGTGALRGIR